MSGVENKEPDVANDIPDDGIPSISFSVKLVGSKDAPKPYTLKMNETVADLRAKLASDDDKSSPNDRLIYSGRILDNSDTVQSIKLKQKAVINCIRRENKPKPVSESTSSSNVQSSATPSNPSARTPTSAIPPTGGSTRSPTNPAAAAAAGGSLPLEGLFGSSQLESLFRDPGQMAAILQDPGFRELVSSNPEILQSVDRLRDLFMTPDGLQSILGARGGAGAGGAPPFPMPEQMGDIAEQIINATGGRLNTPEQLMSLMQEISGRPNEMPSQEELTRFMQALREQQGSTGPLAQGGIPTADLDQMNQLLQMGIRPDMFGGLGSDMDEVALQQLLGAMLDGYDDEFTTDHSQGHASDGEDTNAALAASLLDASAAQGEAGAATTQAPTAQAAPSGEQYATQISQLQAMGFSDLQLIRRALQATEGNVDEALTFLLN